MNVSILERLLIGLESCGVKKYGRNVLVAEKTGYAVGMVAKVLSGHVNLTDRFIQAVCRGFRIRKEWIYNGEGSIEDQGIVADTTDETKLKVDWKTAPVELVKSAPRVFIDELLNGKSEQELKTLIAWLLREEDEYKQKNHIDTGKDT